MTIVVSRGYAWIAAKHDRVAHAHVARGRHLKTLCGLPALDERWAWPALVKCDACTAAVDGRAA